MFNWVYRKSDNVFQFGGPYDPTFDPRHRAFSRCQNTLTRSCTVTTGRVG